MVLCAFRRRRRSTSSPLFPLLVARARNAGRQRQRYGLGETNGGSATCGSPPESSSFADGAADVLIDGGAELGRDGCPVLQMRATRRFELGKPGRVPRVQASQGVSLNERPARLTRADGDVKRWAQSTFRSSTQSLQGDRAAHRAIIFRNR